MKYLFVLLTLLSSLSLSSQDFRGFVEYVEGLPTMGGRQDAVDSFMNVITPYGIPFISNDTAYFVYQGNISEASAVGDFNGWNLGQAYVFDQLADTDLWYHAHVFELHARLDYKLVIDGNWILDPLNTNTVSGGFGPNSELAMPDYIQPWEIEYIGGAGHGAVSSDVLSSPQTGSSFQLKIFLPFGYDANRPAGYPVAYFQDGQESIDLGKAVNVLDNLIDAGDIDPTIGVFVVPNNRGNEYAGELRQEYSAFFVETLVPYIDGKYNTAAVATHRAVIGASYGGNISGYISYNHPEVFANCGIHSGALNPNGNEVFNLIVNGPEKDIRFVSIWGSYESLDLGMLNFRDHLINKGYDLFWDRLPEGHSWGLWRATFDDILKFFFKDLAAITPVMDKVSGNELGLSLNSNSIFYDFQLTESANYTIRIIDMSGKTHHKLSAKSNGRVHGNFTIDELPSGTYSVIVETNRQQFSGKVSIVR